MSPIVREVCPKCIDVTNVVERVEIVRECDSYLVQKITRYCLCCNLELANTVTVKFKRHMG